MSMNEEKKKKVLSLLYVILCIYKIYYVEVQLKLYLDQIITFIASKYIYSISLNNIKKTIFY